MAAALRYLVFRVMFGFGKLKFTTTTRNDQTYIKSFMVNLPMPTPLGWLAAKAPAAVHKLALLFMFVAEMPVPFLVFVGGSARVVAAIVLIALMVCRHSACTVLSSLALSFP